MNEENNRIVIRARAVSHQKCPETKNIVRVKQYQSQLVLIPHTTFNEVGFDILHYYLILLLILGMLKLKTFKGAVHLRNMFYPVGKRHQSKNFKLSILLEKNPGTFSLNFDDYFSHCTNVLHK